MDLQELSHDVAMAQIHKEKNLLFGKNRQSTYFGAPPEPKSTGFGAPHPGPQPTVGMFGAPPFQDTEAYLIRKYKEYKLVHAMMDAHTTPLAMYNNQVVYLGFKDSADGVVVPAMVRAICTGNRISETTVDPSSSEDAA